MNPIPLAPESGAELDGGRGRRRLQRKGRDKVAPHDREQCAHIWRWVSSLQMYKKECVREE